MTISEWLTPGFFELLVILTAAMMFLTFISAASNYFSDFRVKPRTQTAVFAWSAFAFGGYLVLVALNGFGIVAGEPTLYPNRYDILLVGKPLVLGVHLGGLMLGAIVAWRWGKVREVRVALGAAAFGVAVSIPALTLLWLTHQTV